MGRSWNWDFEDRPGGARPPESGAGPGQSPAPELDNRARVRRRRASIGLVSLLALVVIVAALTSGGHAHSASTAQARAGAQPARGSRATAPIPAAPDGNRAVASVLAYTPFVRQGGARGRDVALTFDDGPGPYTPGVLNVLERFHVQGTFFAIGRMERYFSASTVRELRDGDVVGDHTETHPAMAQLSAHDQHEQLFEQIARIELLEGPRPHLFRPPYGSFNATTIRELKALHLLMVLWSVDASDYLQPGVPQIVQRVLAGAHPGRSS